VDGREGYASKAARATTSRRPATGKANKVIPKAEVEKEARVGGGCDQGARERIEELGGRGRITEARERGREGESDGRREGRREGWPGEWVHVEYVKGAVRCARGGRTAPTFRGEAGDPMAMHHPVLPTTTRYSCTYATPA